MSACSESRVSPTQAPSLAVGVDSTSAEEAIVDTSLALHSGGVTVQLRAVDDLIVTDGSVATSSAAIVSAFLRLPEVGDTPSLDVKLEKSLSRVRVFRIAGINVTKDSSVAQRLLRIEGLEFAVPAYINEAAQTDTLIFMNSLFIEFKQDLNNAELRGFEDKFELRLVRAPAKDSGGVNYEFRYPALTRNPIGVINAIAKESMVRLVAPNLWNTGVRLATVPNDPLYSSQFNLSSSSFRFGLPVDVRAELAWTIGLGSGIKIAVLDDGISASHPDLVGRVSGTSLNPTGDNINATAVTWPASHGTAIAGIIAANQGDGIGISGLAPASTLYAVKIFSAGATTTGWIVDALDQSRTVLDVDVINGSWGGYTYDAMVAAAVNRARTLGRGGKGIAMAFATGNVIPAQNTVAFPSSENGVIAVGAIDPAGVRAGYSNGGPRLDVVAPGTGFPAFNLTQEYCSTSDAVPALIASGAPCFGTGLTSGYSRFTGTSATAPQVAAAAALIIERFPTITGSAVRDRIKLFADPWGAQNDVGAGKLNVYLALVGRLKASVSAPSLVSAGVVTKTCTASNGLGSYSFHWYLSYTENESDLFDTGITNASLSQSMGTGENFIFRCVVTDGAQTATAQRSVFAQ